MKKILSMLVAFSLVLTAAVPTFAAETDSKGLEKAITQVKNVVTIPSDYTDFQYSSSQYEDNGKDVSVWYLNWNKTDYSGGISAEVEDGGYLISFNKYVDQQKEGLGTVTKQAGQKTADAFLAKVRPDLAADLRIIENTDSTSTERNSYQYKLYKNDTVVYYASASVDVDKFTGEVVGFNCQNAGEDFSKLPSTDGVIGLEAAQKAYLEKINVSISYYSYFDYTTKKLTIFPAYSGKNTLGKVIDAKTGELVPLYTDFINYGSMGSGDGMAKAESANATEDEFTKEEIAAVENIANLITKEKAESILRNQAPGITSGMKVLNASLSKNYIEQDKYLWEIGFDGAYGVVNAKSGELVSFYIYSEDSTKGTTALTEEKAKIKAENFIKSVAPAKFQESRFYENAGYNMYLDKQDVTDYSFNYYRQVNGVDFVDNGFTVIVNKASGTITSYDCTWYDGATFPSIEKVITEEAAFKAVNQTGNMGLMYKKVNEGETALVYDFTDSVGEFLIDPTNGAKLGWDGNPYKETSMPEYTDITGHWAEATIKKLLENGYYLEGEKFNPGQKITQMSFLRYLYSPVQAYYNDEEFYKMLVSDKVIKDNEKAPTATLTRQDAAKFVVRYLGQGKTAEHPEIFINPFKDNVSDAYKGYAAICYGLKVMQGDKNGRFNGINQVTNAEAAAIIYNALQVK